MRLSTLASCLAVLAAPVAAGEVRVLNWSDYIAPGLIEAFEVETGIDVVYDSYDSGEVVESRLLAGGSTYDLVVVSSEYLSRLISSGAVAQVEMGALPSMKDMSGELLERLEVFDQGNRHAIPYLWGTTGIGYDRDAILSRFPQAPVHSWAMVFDPAIVSRFQDCGVSMVDSPEELLAAALLYLGHDPAAPDQAQIDAATRTLQAVSPYVERFDSEQVWDLANGESCLVVGWSTDIMNGSDKAGDSRVIEYALPDEGGLVWYDSFVIPADAAHPEAALALVDFLLRPANIAATTNHVWAPNASLPALALVDPEIAASPFVYPPEGRMAGLHPVPGLAMAQKRQFASDWNAIKLGF